MKIFKKLLVILVLLNPVVVGSTNIPGSVKEEIENLNSKDPIERTYAAYNLGEKGKEATPAVPFLIDMLNDHSGGITWISPVSPGLGEWTSPGFEALKALGKIGDKRAIIPLINKLTDREDYSTRNEAAKALGRIGGKRAVMPLIAALNDGVILAAWALGNMGDERAVEPLAGVLNRTKNDEGLRALYEGQVVATALIKIGDKRGIDPLITTWKDDDTDYRYNEITIKTLVFAGEQAVEPLIKALKDEHWQVRKNAAEVLGKIGDKRAVMPLIAALNDESTDVCISAENALRTITGQPFGFDAKKWFEWWRKNKTKY